MPFLPPNQQRQTTEGNNNLMLNDQLLVHEQFHQMALTLQRSGLRQLLVIVSVHN